MEDSWDIRNKEAGARAAFVFNLEIAEPGEATSVSSLFAQNFTSE